ncbi:hypothetical protein B9Z55_005469 [Caenorhabditis nigoni]|uniref:Uncharacterized protein n=1 Tax=Caenorhabditis nigoni TaxID=1611254 RepID=A0A2G5V0Z2_9PELO|nr:hypothetical protein B9Z55_005469 [Caenorhabditis nigoni]
MWGAWGKGNNRNREGQRRETILAGANKIIKFPKLAEIIHRGEQKRNGRKRPSGCNGRENTEKVNDTAWLCTKTFQCSYRSPFLDRDDYYANISFFDKESLQC